MFQKALELPRKLGFPQGKSRSFSLLSPSDLFKIRTQIFPPDFYTFDNLRSFNMKSWTELNWDFVLVNHGINEAVSRVIISLLVLTIASTVRNAIWTDRQSKDT